MRPKTISGPRAAQDRRPVTHGRRSEGRLSFEAAAELLAQPGRTLVETKVPNKAGRTFSIVPGGGDIDERVALRLLPLCQAYDAGLLDDCGQSFVLRGRP